MDEAPILGRDPGDENDTEGKVWFDELDGVAPGWRSGPWTPGFPGVPRGTSQPELNIPPFFPSNLTVGNVIVPARAGYRIRVHSIAPLRYDYECSKCKGKGCHQCEGD